MHDIELNEASEEFAQCWQAAARHIQGQVQGPMHNWLKCNLHPPFLEHLSFRLGNQLFFIRIEDVEGNLEAPGNPNGVMMVANGCEGHPCLMPMRRGGGSWSPEMTGWGLLDARTGKPVDPVALVTDEQIEITDWELQDFAVQIVRNELENEGRKLMSWQGNPAVDPSIWFVGDEGREWVVVRASRYPNGRPPVPAIWHRLAESCERLSRTGWFAPVAVANAGDPFDPAKGPSLPLWRGHALIASYEGLIKP